MEKSKKNKIYILISLIIAAVIFLLLSNKKEENSNFEIKNNNLTVKIGETVKIDYELSDPNLVIEWSSNNNFFAVNNNGEVTANDYGTAIITGIVNYNGESLIQTCSISSYSGDITVPLQSVNLPSGYIVMKPGSELDLSSFFVPNNAYISMLKYYDYDENIVTIKDNKIYSNNPGTTSFKASVNNDIIVFGTDIIVSNDAVGNGFVEDFDKVIINDENNEIVSNLTLNVGDNKKLTYGIEPNNINIYNVKWESSDEKVASIIDGEINALSVGNAVITLTINNRKGASINVNVKEVDANLIVDYKPKTVLRIGGQTTIRAHTAPDTIDIEYTSSNPSVASVNNGVVTGISSGKTIITLSTKTGKRQQYTITVLQSSGRINGSGSIWGYSSLNAKVPVQAKTSFFQQLSQKGIGTIQGNDYIITYLGNTFTFNANDSILKVGNKKIKVRIYYPQGEDLSITNTLVYMGGRGETNFGGAFSDISKNTSMIKSAGIVALIAEGEAFNGEAGAYVTKFMKAITKQQSGVKNSILGFSDGAHQVLEAAKYEKYNSIVVFSGYVDYFSEVENANNPEIIFIIASNDGNYRGVKSGINRMKNYGYKNVTLITDATDLGIYEKIYLHIHPGSLMKRGHLTENIFNSKIIEYLND